MTAGIAIVTASIILLYYIYDGYGRLLQLIEKTIRPTQRDTEFEVGALPTVSIILPVYNEEDALAEKLNDLLCQEYTKERIEILVVSDGSTDGTNSIAEAYANRGVSLLHTAGRVGKSTAQNIAVQQANGEIIVLTDVAVKMASNCIVELVRPFADHHVGCVTARLYFNDERKSCVIKDQGLYWKYELRLRRIESSLGWLAVSAGPAMAVRRDLWNELDSRYGDDCMIPLDVILQGREVRQAEKAVAWDIYFSSLTQEFRARVRMTVRNWGGTFSRRSLLNPIKYPRYAFTLWSHKILRWLSPLIICALLLGCLLIWISVGVAWPIICMALIMVMSIVGIIGQLAGKRLAGISSLGTFVVVNAGFAVGLFHILRKRNIRIYSNK